MNRIWKQSHLLSINYIRFEARIQDWYFSFQVEMLVGLWGYTTILRDCKMVCHPRMNQEEHSIFVPREDSSWESKYLFWGFPAGVSLPSISSYNLRMPFRIVVKNTRYNQSGEEKHSIIEYWPLRTTFYPVYTNDVESLPVSVSYMCASIMIWVHTKVTMIVNQKTWVVRKEQHFYVLIHHYNRGQGWIRVQKMFVLLAASTFSTENMTAAQFSDICSDLNHMMPVPVLWGEHQGSDYASPQAPDSWSSRSVLWESIRDLSIRRSSSFCWEHGKSGSGLLCAIMHSCSHQGQGGAVPMSFQLFCDFHMGGSGEEILTVVL